MVMTITFSLSSLAVPGRISVNGKHNFKRSGNQHTGFLKTLDHLLIRTDVFIHGQSLGSLQLLLIVFLT